MEHWWEVVIGVVVVLVASVLFDFASIPSGTGKLGAYLSAAFLPTLVIQYKKVADSEVKLKTGSFVFALVLNTFMVLFFTTVILVVVGRF